MGKKIGKKSASLTNSSSQNLLSYTKIEKIKKNSLCDINKNNKSISDKRKKNTKNNKSNKTKKNKRIKQYDKRRRITVLKIIFFKKLVRDFIEIGKRKDLIIRLYQERIYMLNEVYNNLLLDKFNCQNKTLSIR